MVHRLLRIFRGNQSDARGPRSASSGILQQAGAWRALLEEEIAKPVVDLALVRALLDSPNPERCA